ncbi:MAG TPA: hypothetical protein VFF11_05250, partial [Candidatus Binatia bacterium]|nr:hypothetical protein [Candidatus Binatia bacterium]
FPEIATTLARPEYVGVPAAILLRGLSGDLDCGNGITRQVSDFFVFHHNDANEPSGDKTAWALQLVRASGLCTDPASLNFVLGRRVFRHDLFQLAAKTISNISENSNQHIHDIPENESQLVPL